MNLAKNQKIKMLEQMLLIRRMEERILKEYKAKNITGAIHLSIGQEAVAVGICSALRTDDYLFSTHRGHGHAIAKGCDLKRMLAELMGRDSGLCRGHGGSMHLYQTDIGLMGGNGIVGGGIPLALGPAFTAQYKGTDQVSAGFFSEGASNQGVFHESLNLAALWKLPVVYVCENNCYAATTPVKLSCANQDIAAHAQGYGIPGVIVDGNAVLEVYRAAQNAVNRARAGEGPTLIECKTYRIEPHCGIIKDEREPGERERWQEKDPIDLYKNELLKDESISDIDFVQIETEVQTIIQQAVDFALSSPFPDKDALHNRTWDTA